LRQDGAAEADGNLAKFVGVPAARLHFVLEEALHLRRVRCRAAVLNYGADVLSNVGWGLHDPITPHQGRRLPLSCGQCEVVASERRTVLADQPATTCVACSTGLGSTNLSYIHSRIAVRRPTAVMTHH